MKRVTLVACILIVCATLMMAGLATAGQPKAHTVGIELDDNNCPVVAFPNQISVAAADTITWQSVTIFRNPEFGIIEAMEPAPKSFSILFAPFPSPFVNQSFQSRPDGIARSTPIQGGLTEEEAVYKYTVVSSDDSDCPPLDPSILVEAEQ